MVARQAHSSCALSLPISLLLKVSVNRSAGWEQSVYFHISKSVTRVCKSPSFTGMSLLRHIIEVLGVGLLQLVPITCSLVASHVTHTLAAPAFGPCVPETPVQTDLRPSLAVPGAGEGLQVCAAEWPFAKKAALALSYVPSLSAG